MPLACRSRVRPIRPRPVLALLALGAGLLAFGLPTTGQVPDTHPVAPGSPLNRPGFGTEPPSPEMSRRIEHMREDERHKRLLADTQKLVQLTNELKTEVDSASKDELSLDVVRKATEIEKLAHDVRERMKS